MQGSIKLTMVIIVLCLGTHVITINYAKTITIDSFSPIGKKTENELSTPQYSTLLCFFCFLTIFMFSMYLLHLHCIVNCEMLFLIKNKKN